MYSNSKLDHQLKSTEKAIEFELVNEETAYKSKKSQQTPHPVSSKVVWKNGKSFQEANMADIIKLCCVQITSGPGTSFKEFKIPSGAKCYVCG